MGIFFIGSDYHDDMLGNDGQLKLRYRYLPKEELEQISKSLYEAEQSVVKCEPVVLERFCDVELPPVVKILSYFCFNSCHSINEWLPSADTCIAILIDRRFQAYHHDSRSL